MSAVLPVGDHFELDGRRFVPLGHVEEPRILMDRQDEYLSYCAGHGENVLRLLLEPVPYECFTETGTPGNYSKMTAYLDPIAGAAAKHGMLLDLGCYFPNWNAWTSNPYAVMGAAKSYQDLFVPTCTWMLKGRLTLLADRYREVLFGLEFCCELYDRRDAWVEEMLAFCRELNIMGSVSVIQDVGAYGWAQWSSPNLPYVSVHSYGKGTGLFFPWLPWTAQGARAIERRLANVDLVWFDCKSKGAVGKPILDTETPRVPLSWWARLMDRWSLVGVSQADMERSFYEVASRYMTLGAAGPGWQWSSAHSGALVDGRPNALSPAMYSYQEKLRSLWG